MSRSFGLGAETALEELEDAFERFRKDSLDKELARDCAFKAWRLCDLVHAEHAASLRLPGRDAFHEQVRASCPELAHLQVVGNASKHGERLRRTGQVKEARQHEGAFSQEFDRSFDIDRLEIELNNGSRVDFEDGMDKAVTYWNGFFSMHGLR